MARRRGPADGAGLPSDRPARGSLAELRLRLERLPGPQFFTPAVTADLFARRDAFWAAGDPAFYEINDALQYLGFLAFRAPVPAYKHSAAMFLKEFAEDTPWIHLDIAGTAWMEDNKPWIAKGPSGIALRSLVEFVKGWGA